MDDIQDFIRLLEEFERALNEIARHVSTIKMSELGITKVVILDLMKRMHANMHAIKLIMPEISETRPLVVPLSIVIRTCLSDALTGFYLITFLDDKISFENELNIMTLEYISYLEKLALLEPHFYFRELDPKAIEDLINIKLDEIVDTYPDLIHKRDKFKINRKQPKEIRQNSEKQLFFSDEEISSPLTDKSKFERLFNFKDEGTQSISYLYPLFRFYSQFHHYTVNTRNLMDLNISEHLRHLTLSFVLIHQAIFAFGKSIQIPDILLKPFTVNIDTIYEKAKVQGES